MQVLALDQFWQLRCASLRLQRFDAGQRGGALCWCPGGRVQPAELAGPDDQLVGPGREKFPQSESAESTCSAKKPIFGSVYAALNVS